jgi:hypothetical protein
MRLPHLLKFLILFPVIGLFLACEPSGEARTETKQVALQGAETAEVNVRMGAGELRLEGGAAGLMEASFRTNRPSLEPEVDYSVVNGRGILTVRHKRHHRIGLGRTINDWDIRLNSETPTNLRVKLGAGESRVDCRAINLDRLSIDMGVGQTTVNLSGPRAKSLDVHIEGGIGSGTVILPRDVGVRVTVEKGLGSVEAEGLTKSGHVYTNEAYGRSEVTLEVKVEAGIGSIRLKEW